MPTWLLAALLGLVVVIATVSVLALAKRLLPQGPARELVGFIPNCVALLRAARAEGRLTRRGRLAIGAALAYVVSPIQLIPNFIPVVGQLDDLVVVTAALRYAARSLPRSTLEAAWNGDPATLDRLLGPHRSETDGEAPP